MFHQTYRDVNSDSKHPTYMLLRGQTPLLRGEGIPSTQESSRRWWVEAQGVVAGRVGDRDPPPNPPSRTTQIRAACNNIFGGMGNFENLNQQRTLRETHLAMEHKRGHMSSLSKMHSEKHRGFSVVSNFDRGCACAMWADHLLLRVVLSGSPAKAKTSPVRLRHYLVRWAEKMRLRAAIWLPQLPPKAKTGDPWLESPIWRQWRIKGHVHCQTVLLLLVRINSIIVY